MKRFVFPCILLLGAVCQTHAQPKKIITTISPTLTSPTLIINKVNPVKILTDSYIGIFFTFKNDNKVAQKARIGNITATIHKDGQPDNPATTAFGKFTVNQVAIGASVDGVLEIKSPLNGGPWVIDLEYNEISMVMISPGVLRGKSVQVSNAFQDIQVIEDKDGDGIDDAVEAHLLEKFRPYYKFSIDEGTTEQYRPADCAWYLSKSQLLTSGTEDDKFQVVTNAAMAANPNAILFNGSLGSSNILTQAAATNYHVNPLAHLPGDPNTDPGRHGEDWGTVLAQRNVGLYGHVVPIDLYPGVIDGTVFSRTRDQLVIPNTAKKTYYKVEYWQFFGYNDGAAGTDVSDHESDWTSVQLLVDPLTEHIYRIYHFAHGDMMSYNMDAPNQQTVPMENNMIHELRSAFGYNTNEDLHDLGKISDNLVEVYKDPVSNEYTHPVVYIEFGGHEFWPSKDWTWPVVHNHNGADQQHSYLTATPPNLGEVDFPLTNAAGAQVIVQYNGFWGAFSRSLPGIVDTDPPHGPNLHQQWTYPTNSSVSPRLPINMGF